MEFYWCYKQYMWGSRSRVLAEPYPGAQGSQPDIVLAVPSGGIPKTKCQVCKSPELVGADSTNTPAAPGALPEPLLLTASSTLLPSTLNSLCLPLPSRALCGLFFPH